jgi:hypothetical protein
MGPNKREEQFRDKLNAREINPSAQVWDRLDAMLSVAEEKKTRRPYGFLFIAASILVLAMLGIFFFTQNGTEVKPSTTIVETETKQHTVQKGAANFQEPILEETQKNPIAINQLQSSPGSQPNRLERSWKNQKTAVNQKTNDNQNQINKDKEIDFMISGELAIKDLPRIPNTDGILIISGKSIGKSDEVLLADLDKTAKQSTNQKAVVKVDAKSLLSQADGEVDYTFREKVINRVNKNYQEVKVALANRNKE